MNVNVSGSVNNNDAYQGGGIYNYSGGTVLVNGQVNGNRVNDPLFPHGAGIYTWGANITINGEIKGNATLTSNGIGGGIYFGSGAGPSTIINGRIIGNTVTNRGGGIYIGAGTVNFGTGNLIQNNTSTGGVGTGGGIYVNAGGMIAGASRNYGTGNTPDNCAPVGPGCP